MPAIEIRPRRATELVDAGFQLMRRYYSLLITVAAIAMAPSVIWRVVMRDMLSDPTVMIAHPGVTITNLLIALVFTTIADAVLVVAVSDGYLNGSVDLASAVTRGGARVIQVLATSIIRWLLLGFSVMLVGVASPLLLKLHLGLLLVLVIPLGVWFVFYVVLRTFAVAQAVLLEQKGPLEAFTRSVALSEKCAAHIFFSLGLVFLLYIVIYGVTLGIASTLVSRWVSEIIGGLAAVAIYPILATVTTLLYYDLRVRKEGFDLEVMSRELGMAGGAPGEAPLPAA